MAVNLTISNDDFDFIVNFDPDRDRSANRRQLVEVIEEIKAILIEGRQ